MVASQTIGGSQAPQYQRRQPEASLLYQAIAKNLATFIQDNAAHGGTLPGFVRREFESYLGCGILAHGFVRVRCGDCAHNHLVAFSCKGRGFCPSCGVRRMADRAAHLVDHVLPHVPVRQWVLSLPHAVRFRVAYDRALCRQVLGFFIRALLRHYRKVAKRYLGLPSMKLAHGGSVTCIQRFSSSLSLNVHFHALVLDGVYVEDDTFRVRFRALPAPAASEVAAVAAEVAAKTRDALGMSDEEGPSAGALPDREPLLAACAAASVQGRIATGSRAGKNVVRLGTGPPAMSSFVPKAQGPHAAQAQGFDIHAGVRVPAAERGRLEKLCRYILRPPLSQERLLPLSDGRLTYVFKRPWSDGTTAIALTPLELIEKLVPLIPPPRAHQVVYHGVLAPHARLRPAVVPAEPASTVDEKPRCRRGPLDWATLLRRVYAIDVLSCPRCGSRMTVIATITQVEVIRKILRSCGLPSAPPERGVAARPEQQDWESPP